MKSSFVVECLGACVLATVSLGVSASYAFAIHVFVGLYLLGRIIACARMTSQPFSNSVLWIGAALGTLSLTQTAWYYTGALLGRGSDVLAIAVAFIVARWIAHGGSRENEADDTRSSRTLLQHTLPIVSIACMALLCVAVFLVARQGATLDAIRTPWSRIPLAVTFLIALLSICGVLAKRTRAWACAMAASSGALGAVTALVYPLGFGFDGFLHIASQRVLLESGTLVPRVPYYIGQYTLGTWLARLTGAPLETITPWILFGGVVVCAAACARAFAKIADAAWIPLGFFILAPITLWISLTPQSLAFILGVAALFSAFAYTQSCTELSDADTSLALTSVVFALWAMAVHPLGGLPLATGAGIHLLWTLGVPRWLKHSGSVIGAVASAVCVPFAFYLLSRTSSTAQWHGFSLSIEPLRAALQSLWFEPMRFSGWADWAATSRTLGIAWSAGALIAAWKASKEHASLRYVALAGALTLMASTLLTSSFTVQSVIAYEQTDYVKRIGAAGWLLLMPMLFLGHTHLMRRVRSLASPIAISFICLLIAIACGRIYRAYPYHDASRIEHGWNVSRDDMEAVRWIDANADGETYTVLANQAVSAAAIEAYGFARYTPENVFYYPIPTGGDLYEVFLRAASLQATAQDIRDAAHLGASRRVYVVVNNYWWDASSVQTLLETHADEVHETSHGAERIYVFRDASSLTNWNQASATSSAR